MIHEKTSYYESYKSKYVEIIRFYSAVTLDWMDWEINTRSIHDISEIDDLITELQEAKKLFNNLTHEKTNRPLADDWQACN